MDNFYDLNDFIMFLLRKWKNCLGIIFISVLIFVGTRGGKLINQYINQNENNNIETNNNEDEPVWTKALVNIEITPLYYEKNGEIFDKTQTIIEGYRKLGISQNVMEQLYNTWFEKESEESVRRKQKLHEYGYILDKEVKYPYEKVDFWGQFLMDGVDINSISRTVGVDNSKEYIMTMGFKSTDEELALQIANDYARIVTELVKEEVGEFEYNILGNTVLYELPAASAGAQTTRYLSSGGSNTYISKKYVVLQSIKGAIWGGMFGVIIAIVLIFFAYMMSHKINTLNDLEGYNKTILGLGFVNSSKYCKLRAKIYSVLGGKIWDPTGHEQIIDSINWVANNEKYYSVAVMGSGNDKITKKMVLALNEKASNVKYYYCDWNMSLEELEQEYKNENKNVIIIEEFGISLKKEVKDELNQIAKRNMNLIGIVGIES